MENKFESLFNENMTADEVKNIFFSTLERVSTEERKRLIEAFAPILCTISTRESKEKVYTEDDNIDYDEIDRYRTLSVQELDYILDVFEKDIKARLDK